VRFDLTQICPQRPFTVHSVYEPDFHTRQLNVCRQQVNALAVMQNTVTVSNQGIVNHVLHNICKRNRQFVRLGVTEGKRQRSLCVRVDQQNPFVFLRQPDTEICSRRGLAHAAFLVRHRDNFAIRHLGFPPLHRFSRLRRWQTAMYGYEKSRLFHYGINGLFG